MAISKSAGEGTAVGSDRALSWDDTIGPEADRPASIDLAEAQRRMEAARAPEANREARPPPVDGWGEPTLEDIAAAGEEPKAAKGSPGWASEILNAIAGREFDPDNPPNPLSPIIKFKGTPVGTAGNLVLLSGQAGCAKSHNTAAIIASALAPEGTAPDCLGWAMPNPEGKAVVYLDFEQSAQDFHALMKSAMRRAGVSEKPPWFTALHLTGTEPTEGQDILQASLQDGHVRFGGVQAALVDGIADLVESPNDEAEAFGVVRKLHKWADQFETVIFGILHLNAGADSLKMRGHLGSQAERKAETVLTAKRNCDTITVYATKTRHKPISEAEGARFAWDEEAGGFATVATVAEEKASRKDETNRQLAADLFATVDGLSYTETIDRLSELTGKSESTAKRRLGELREGGFVKIQAGTGFYHKGPNA